MPTVPTTPGIYIWCVKNIDTISGLTSTPCKYDTIKILPTVTPTNGTYISGGIGNPANISVLITSISTGSKAQWCDVNGNNCSVTAPVLPSTPGIYTWCVKAIDNNSGLISAACKFDTVTIIAPATLLDINKKVDTVQLLADGSFLVKFNIKVTNKMSVRLDSVQIKDDLSPVFGTAVFSILSVKASGNLISNGLYTGLGVIDLVTPQSTLGANLSDSIMLWVKLNPGTVAGNYNNVALMQGKTIYGTGQLASNDPVANPSNPASRQPTAFVIPKLDIVIPGGFSPNQDGTDDKFVITRPSGTTIELRVFNRWGNQVYYNSDYKNDWDGRGQGNFLGQYVPQGTYYYIVVATDRSGVSKKFAGPLTIIR